MLVPIGSLLNGCSDEQTAVPDVFINDMTIIDNLKSQIPIYALVFILLTIQLIMFCALLAMELCGKFKEPNIENVNDVFSKSVQ